MTLLEHLQYLTNESLRRKFSKEEKAFRDKTAKWRVKGGRWQTTTYGTVLDNPLPHGRYGLDTSIGLEHALWKSNFNVSKDMTATDGVKQSSILPNNSPEIYKPRDFNGGILFVQWNEKRDVHILFFRDSENEPAEIASHNNGFSVFSLATKMIGGDKTKISDQAKYIKDCGGEVVGLLLSRRGTGKDSVEKDARLGQVVGGDLGSDKNPVDFGGQFGFIKDGFVYYRNAPYGERDGSNGTTIYNRVTDPRTQNVFAERIRKAGIISAKGSVASVKKRAKKAKLDLKIEEIPYKSVGWSDFLVKTPHGEARFVSREGAEKFIKKAMAPDSNTLPSSGSFRSLLDFKRYPSGVHTSYAGYPIGRDALEVAGGSEVKALEMLKRQYERQKQGAIPSEIPTLKRTERAIKMLSGGHVYQQSKNGMYDLIGATKGYSEPILGVRSRTREQLDDLIAKGFIIKIVK